MENVKKSFIASIPSVVLLDKRVSPHGKLIYAEIFSLSDENGESYPSNKHFAQMFDLSERTISLLINQLKEFGLIDTVVENRNKRTIRIILGGIEKNFIGDRKKSRGGWKKISTKITIENTLKNNNIDTGTKNVPSVEDEKFSLEDELKDIDKSDRIKTEYQFQGLNMWENLGAPVEKKGSFIKVARDEKPGFVNEAYNFAKAYPVKAIRWQMFFKKLANLRKGITA